MRKVKYEIFVSTIHDGLDYEPETGFVKYCQSLLQEVGFSGATITKGYGVWESNTPEKTYIVTVSASAYAYRDIVEFCLKLAAAFHQDCVMLGVTHSAYDEFFIGGFSKGDDDRIFKAALSIYEKPVAGALGV